MVCSAVPVTQRREEVPQPQKAVCHGKYSVEIGNNHRLWRFILAGTIMLKENRGKSVRGQLLSYPLFPRHRDVAIAGYKELTIM